jgi:hypothetical protein
MTTSSGLGPANGSVFAIGVALYGSVKKLSGCWAGLGGVLNMVFAKAEGSAWSGGGVSMGESWLSAFEDSRLTGVGAFSWGFESFRFRRGNPRDEDPAFGSLDLDESSVRFAMGASTRVLPLDFCSWAFFFLAAAKTCNFDIFGTPSGEPPSSPPRGYKGAMKVACRSSGILSHGISPKKSLTENGFEHSSFRDPTHSPSAHSS